MKRLALLLSFCASSGGAADDWLPLSGAEIRSALTDRKLVYATAWQEFKSSGRTLYNAGHDSWGYWRVEGDHYCSLWPPSDLWNCYTMTRSGDDLRFVDKTGHVTEAEYADD
ncbi:MAG: hypothetical protein AB8B85_08730 [Paracoccaceae bacterium]